MVRNWLSQSHSGTREIAGLAALYGLYEVIRGAGTENVQAAMRHTDDIVAVEQSLGVYFERGIQQAFEGIPYAPALPRLPEVTRPLPGPAVPLPLDHRRLPDRFPPVRTTFVIATALA